DGGQDRERHYSVGVHEATSSKAERMRKIVVLGDSAAQAGGGWASGVGRKREHQQDRNDGHVVEETSSKDGGGQHRENTLVAGLARLRGDDAVGFDEIRNTGKERGEQKNDYRERALRIFDGRLAKGLHAIADRFHTSERR